MWKRFHICDIISINPSYKGKCFKESCRKIKTHFMFDNFFRKLCLLWGNVEKYGGAREATDCNMIQRMRFACWMTKVAHTYSEYVTRIAFPRQQ